MMESRKSLVLSSFLIVLLFVGATITAAPQRSESVRVIITVGEGFNENTVSAVGGRVIAKGKLFSIIIAELPEEAVEHVAKAEGVIRVERDSLVQVFGGKPSTPPGKDKKGASSQPPQQIPWGIQRICAPDAWGVSDGASGGVIEVAIIDTGVDRDHPDLKANIAWGVSVLNGRVSTKPNAYQDRNGHGTHVAGIVAALNNDIGVVGVAPAVEIYVIKAIGDSGFGFVSDIILGIEQALLGPDGVLNSDDDNVIVGDPQDDAAEVISMSFGSSSDSPSLHDALIKAYSYGVVLVAAAGNDGATSPSYPAAYEEVIAVGAINSDGNVADWSNRGVELTAPGVDILSSYPDDSYEVLSGTSMACPHVSGVAALIQATYYNNYGIVLPVGESYDQGASTVRGVLHTAVDDLGGRGWDADYGYGVVRADLAVRAVQPQ